MAITDNQILTWLGFTVAAKRAAIMADFLSDGLSGLEFMKDDDVKETCSSYSKRSDDPFPIIMNPQQKQRMRALALWVQDMIRAGQDVEFIDGTTRAEFIQALDESFTRHRRRIDQKKIGESFHDHSFNTKLKSQAQWQKFTVELESTLSMIIGTAGAALTYVIRADEAPIFDEDISYEEAIIQALHLDTEDFKIDARTVHQLILLNVHEDSDAYTYIKPLLRYQDGRRDMLALRKRYSNEATKQAIINAAKSTLETLRYKNERSFSFERFSAKLQKAYDDLEDNDRQVNNGDIVDSLWEKIQTTDIQIFLATLKVDYTRNPRSYKDILQDIAAEIATKKPAATSLGRQANVSVVYTRQGTPPNNGVYNSNGEMFIGSYSRDQWFDESVKPHHQEIRKARENDPETNALKGDKRRRNANANRNVNAIRRKKKKLKALNQKIAAAKVTFADPIQSKVDTDSSKDTNKNNNAGDAFGGKNSRKE